MPATEQGNEATNAIGTRLRAGNACLRAGAASNHAVWTVTTLVLIVQIFTTTNPLPHLRHQAQSAATTDRVTSR